MQCEDDTEEALRRQLKGYRKEAETIKEHYDKQGSPSSVMDPDQNPSRVIEDILEALGRPERSP